MKITCLPVDVYRFRRGDCTNGGVSSWFDELLIACPDGSRSFDPDVESPLNFCGIFTRYGMAYLCPAVVVPEDGTILPRPGWWMYGGNIADSSDSRWRELTGMPYPLHIHDRKE